MKDYVLNQMTLCADGSIGIQWLKRVVDDATGEVLFAEPHRTVVDFDGDVDAQIAGAVDHLNRMGYRVSPDEASRQSGLLRKIKKLGDGDAVINAVRLQKIQQRAAAKAAAEQAASGG